MRYLRKNPKLQLFFTWLTSYSLSAQYSGAQKKVYEYCFVKQKCQLQLDIAQYENVVTPLGFWGINATHQHFEMRYVTLF